MSTKTALIISVIAIVALVSLFSFRTITGNDNAPSDIPLVNMQDRAQLLTFGLYVTPDSTENPINPPERFTGYHTALDIEILDEEAATDVLVKAVCDGKVLQSGFVEGYGGLIVQHCVLDDQDVTVMYGHLDTTTLAFSDMHVVRGQTIGKLAPPQSESSGHTRKHLHLGIHKGTTIDVRGYVNTEEDLQQFLDPKAVLNL